MFWFEYSTVKPTVASMFKINTITDLNNFNTPRLKPFAKISKFSGSFFRNKKIQAKKNCPITLVINNMI